MTEELLQQLTSGISALLPEAATLRRQIHANPQLSGHEEPTRDLFQDATDWLSWAPVADTGAWARLGPAGPAVGLRAELDALPIEETTTVEWRSHNPSVMHACGHDVHLAALWTFLNAAREIDLPYAVVPVLQPREEVTPPGAADVVASGLLEAQQIEAMIGVHVQPQVERGIVSTGAGAVNAAYDSFEIVVRGRPGHGAYPHLAVDPISTLAAIITSISALPAQLIDPTHPTVISIGEIIGGTAPNVIAAEARCRGTIRSFSQPDRELLHLAIQQQGESIAAARRIHASVTITPGGPALVNDPALVRQVDRQLGRLGQTVAETPFRSCGSDDFAEYGSSAAAVMCFIGTGQVDGAGLHHGSFLPERDALELAAQAYAAGYVAACELFAESDATA